MFFNFEEHFFHLHFFKHSDIDGKITARTFAGISVCIQINSKNLEKYGIFWSIATPIQGTLRIKLVLSIDVPKVEKSQLTFVEENLELV